MSAYGPSAACSPAERPVCATSGCSIDIAESLPTIAADPDRIAVGDRSSSRSAHTSRSATTPTAIRHDDLGTIARDRFPDSVNRKPPLRKTRVRIRRFS